MNKVNPHHASLTIVAGLLMSVPAFAQAPQPGPPGNVSEPTKQVPKYIPGGFDLPNGWRITPAGKAIATIEDLVLNLVVSPDGRIVVASHSGYLPHGIDVFDVKTQKQIQHIELKSTWLGMTWSADSHTLYVSGGNATGVSILAFTLIAKQLELLCELVPTAATVAFRSPSCSSSRPRSARRPCSSDRAPTRFA